MFFSRSVAKQRVITKYSVRAAIITAVIASAIGIYFNKKEVVIPDYYGDVVKIDTEVIEKELPVDIRKNCRISKFGLAPVLNQKEKKDFTWDRGMRKALLRSGVPLSTVEKAMPKLLSGQQDEFIGMGNTHGITKSGLLFYPTFMTTFKSNERYGACADSRTNFSTDTQQEFAKLFFVDGWYIGEFIACSNVSIFHLAPNNWIPKSYTPVVPDLSVLPDSNGHIVPPIFAVPIYPTTPVPEPSTWLLILLALLFIYVINRK